MKLTEVPWHFKQTERSSVFIRMDPVVRLADGCSRLVLVITAFVPWAAWQSTQETEEPEEVWRKAKCASPVSDVRALVAA